MGAVVHTKCLFVLGSHILTGGSMPLPTLRLAALVLRATVYDKTMSGEMASIMKDICKLDATRHGKRRRELIELLFLIGYTPSKKDYSKITDGFSEKDSAEI